MSKGFVNFKSKIGKVAVTGLLVGATTIGAHAATMEAVTTANLNLRTGESTNHKVLTTIKKGEKVEVLNNEGSWWKVKYKNQTGYSYKNYLRITNNKPTEQRGTVSVGNSRLNVRTGASTDYRIIGKLYTGDKIEITGSKGSWYEINYKGNLGYVSKKYVTNVHSAGNNEGSTAVNKVMKVNTGNANLNVRSGAGTSYSVKGKLASGTLVNVIEKTSNGWYKIEFGNGTGFVSGQYLVDVSNTGNGSTEKVEVIGTAKVNTGGPRLNLRKGAGTNTSILAKLADGLTVEIVKDNNPVKGWTKVKVGNLVGYVSSDFLGKITETPVKPEQPEKPVQPEEKPEKPEVPEKPNKPVEKPGAVINNAPVITAKEDLVLQVGDKFDKSMLEIKATDLEDKDLTDQVVVEGTVDTETPGRYELTLRVEDKDGAETIKKVVVVVEEKVVTPDTKPGTVMNNAPVLEAVEELVVEEDSIFTNDLLQIVATDKEDGVLTEEVVVSGDVVDTNNPGEYNVVLTVTDSKGAKATKIVRVIVEMKQNPSVPGATINGAPVIESVDSLTLTVGDEYSSDMLKVKVTDRENDKVTLTIDDSAVNTNKEGNYEVTITATDAKGAKTVKKVVVTVNAKPSVPGTAINNVPVLNVNNYALDINTAFSNDMLGANATDKDGDKVTISYEGTVNTKRVGTYNVTVTATDAKGAKVSKTVQVKVNAVKPVINANSITITEGDDFNYNMLGATATDCEGTPLAVEYSGTVNNNQEGVYEVTVTTQDKWGLTASKVVTVTVEKQVQQGITDPNSSEFQAMVANEMYALINAHRTNNGVAESKVLGRLQNMAIYKSKHMADNNYFDHTYNGQFIWEINPEFGEATAENIAQNNMNDLMADGVLTQEDAVTLAHRLFNQWKNSTGHNNTMLDKWNKEMGFGFYVEKDSYGNYTVYATQLYY